MSPSQRETGVTRAQLKAKMLEPSQVDSGAAAGPSEAEVAAARKTAHIYIFIVFGLTGVTQLIGWNAMLNGLPSMIDVVFNVKDYSSTVTATYCTCILVFTLPFLVKKWVSSIGLHFGMTLSSIVALSFALTCQLCTNASAAKALFHVYAVFFAIAACFIANNAFGMAAEFPGQYGGAVSTGMGVAGVLTFTVWMIATYGVFDPNTTDGVRGSIWTLCLVLVILSPIVSVSVWALYRRKDVQILLEARRLEAMDEEKNTEYELYDDKGLWALYKACWIPATALMLTLGITLTNFPVIGPLAWENNTAAQRDVLTGNFQVCDLLARYIPNILPFIMLSPGKILIAGISRVITVVLFMMCAIWDDKAFWGSFAWQFILMLVMALTNGWLNTLTFMTACDGVPGNKSKQKAMSIALLHSYVGLAGGQWIGYGLAKLT